MREPTDFDVAKVTSMLMSGLYCLIVSGITGVTALASGPTESEGWVIFSAVAAFLAGLFLVAGMAYWRRIK